MIRSKFCGRDLVCILSCLKIRLEQFETDNTAREK